jgi:hypothetical protein
MPGAWAQSSKRLPPRSLEIPEARTRLRKFQKLLLIQLHRVPNMDWLHRENYHSGCG